MINQVVDGIVNALYDTFGNEYARYTEDTEQINEPCFIIRCIDAANSRIINNRFRRTHQCMVQYFCDSAEKYYTCDEMTTQLYDALEYIVVDDCLTMASSMDATVVDGVLNFEVSYDFDVIKQAEQEEPMEELETNIVVKE